MNSNRKQYQEYMDREHDKRMADADEIEVVPETDSLGIVRWAVQCYMTRGNYRQYIGGMSNSTLEDATREAQRYATLPGSLVYNSEI